MSCVYWITGFSGAGKTTIGKIFYEKLKSVHPETVFLDGDIMREVFGNDLGYTEDDRRRCAMRYSRLCQLLEKQDINVVCCTISMFDSIRDWNRKNISNYKEIYVKVSDNVLNKRNQKGLYSAAAQGKNSSVAGVNICVEEPRNPDLILLNDGDKTPEEQATYIEKCLCERFSMK